MNGYALIDLNVSKNEFIIFQFRKQKLHDHITLKLNITMFESYKIKYLGIILDDQLNSKANS